MHSDVSLREAGQWLPAGRRALGRTKAGWDAGPGKLPAAGGGMMGRAGHGSARLPWHWVLLPSPAAFEGLVP